MLYGMIGHKNLPFVKLLRNDDKEAGNVLFYIFLGPIRVSVDNSHPVRVKLPFFSVIP